MSDPISPNARPRPAPDADSEPWWDGLLGHELLLQRCDDCARARWPPRALCGDCGSLVWRWVPAVGRGTIASWIVNHHGFTPAFASRYTVVLVRLDDQDDLLVPGAWAGRADGADLAIDLPVVAGFEDVASDLDGSPFVLLRWEPGT